MEIEGKVIAVLPKVSGTSANGTWSRQTVVIEYMNGEYPANIALENSQKAEEFGRLKIGDTIKAKFSVASREYNGKWYTSIKCFAWDIVGGAAPAPQEQTSPTELDEESKKDDLPF